MSMLSLMGALEIGLIFALVALGVWISFRVLDFPDLTADGSFPLGGATAATLISAGRKAGVSLVIDNLQSGGRGGAAIARELGVPVVVLTNFPTPDGYPAALRQNAAALQAALAPTEAAP